MLKSKTSSHEARFLDNNTQKYNRENNVKTAYVLETENLGNNKQII